MTEGIRPRLRPTDNSHDPGGPTGEEDILGNMAYVISASGQREMLPIAGNMVAEIRRRLADRLNIDPTAQAMIGSEDVGPDVVLKPGEYLYFRRQAGEKGARNGSPTGAMPGSMRQRSE